MSRLAPASVGNLELGFCLVVKVVFGLGGGLVARVVLVEGGENRPILASHSIRILDKYLFLAESKEKMQMCSKRFGKP